MMDAGHYHRVVASSRVHEVSFSFTPSKTTDEKGTLVSCNIQTRQPCLVMWRIVAEPDNIDKITFDEGSQKVFKHGDAGFSFSVYFQRGKKYVFMIDRVAEKIEHSSVVVSPLIEEALDSVRPAYYDEPQFYKNVPEAYL